MSLRIAARVLPLLGGVLLLVVLALAFSTSTSQSDTFSNTMTEPHFPGPWSKAKLLPREHNSNQPNILDGCHHVYLDMGSNMWDTKQRTTPISSNPRGIQIRKVYEPKLFPHAAMLPIFDNQVIKKRCLQHESQSKNPRLRPGAVCSVGWEPNPAFTPVLASLEGAYNRCGWKVCQKKINTSIIVTTNRWGYTHRQELVLNIVKPTSRTSTMRRRGTVSTRFIRPWNNNDLLRGREFNLGSSTKVFVYWNLSIFNKL